MYDGDGRHARLWLPELSGLGDAEIHTPWEASPSTLEQAGIALGADYPRPIVDLEASQREQRAAWEQALG